MALAHRPEPVGTWTDYLPFDHATWQTPWGEWMQVGGLAGRLVAREATYREGGEMVMKLKLAEDN